MTQCKYEYNSINNLRVSGMDLSHGISLFDVPKITSILTGRSKSIPVEFLLNLNVTNPNQTPAMLHGFSYIIDIDNIEFTRGQVAQDLDIPASGTQVLSATIGFDVVTLLRGSSKDAVTKILKNFVGLSDSQSTVTVQIKPTFMIAGIPITYPSYIPVKFSFGGKK